MIKIILNDEIGGWFDSSDLWVEKLLTAKDKTEPIELLINSPGGDVISGWALYNALKQWKGEITATIIGQASSIAALIYLAANKRKAYKYSMLMFHRAWAWLAGDSEEFDTMSEVLKKIDNLLIDSLKIITGKEETELNDLLTKEWYLIGGKEIVDSMIGHEIIDNSEGNPEDQQVKDRKELRIAAKKAFAVSSKTLIALKNMNILKNNKKEVVNPMTDEEKKKMDELAASVVKMQSELEAKKKDKPKSEQLREKIINDVLGILELANIELSESTINAIKSGQSKEEFAYNRIKEINSEKGVDAKKTNAIESLTFKSKKEIKPKKEKVEIIAEAIANAISNPEFEMSIENYKEVK